MSIRFAEITEPVKAWDGNIQVMIEPASYEIVDYIEDNYGRGFIIFHPELGNLGLDAEFFEGDVDAETLEPIPPQFVIKETA